MPESIKKYIVKIIFCIEISFLSGCELIEYHPYDTRIYGDKGINYTQIEKIENSCSSKESIHFILMGDSQRCYDETEDFVHHVNARNDIDFVIHGGDVSDFGLTREFIWARDIMNKLNVPYVTLIGNHDVLGNGKAVFEEIFGTDNFSFIAKYGFLGYRRNMDYDEDYAPIKHSFGLNLTSEDLSIGFHYAF